MSCGTRNVGSDAKTPVPPIVAKLLVTSVEGMKETSVRMTGCRKLSTANTMYATTSSQPMTRKVPPDGRFSTSIFSRDMPNGSQRDSRSCMLRNESESCALLVQRSAPKADNNIKNNIDSVTRMVRNTRLPGFKRGGCRGTSCMYCSPFRAVKLLLLFSIPTVVVNHNAPKIQVGVASIVVTTNIRSSWIPQCPHNGII